MAYVFLLPNFVFFGLFVFAADRHQRRVLGDRRHRAVSLASGPMSAATSTPICSTAAPISIPSSCREDHFWRGVDNTAIFVVFQVTAMVLFSLVTAWSST